MNQMEHRREEDQFNNSASSQQSNGVQNLTQSLNDEGNVQQKGSLDASKNQSLQIPQHYKQSSDGHLLKSKNLKYKDVIRSHHKQKTGVRPLTSYVEESKPYFHQQTPKAPKQLNQRSKTNSLTSSVLSLKNLDIPNVTDLKLDQSQDDFSQIPSFQVEQEQVLKEELKATDVQVINPNAGQFLKDHQDDFLEECLFQRLRFMQMLNEEKLQAVLTQYEIKEQPKQQPKVEAKPKERENQQVKQEVQAQKVEKLPDVKHPEAQQPKAEVKPQERENQQVKQEVQAQIVEELPDVKHRESPKQVMVQPIQKELFEKKQQVTKPTIILSQSLTDSRILENHQVIKNEVLTGDVTLDRTSLKKVQKETLNQKKKNRLTENTSSKSTGSSGSGNFHQFGLPFLSTALIGSIGFLAGSKLLSKQKSILGVIPGLLVGVAMFYKNSNSGKEDIVEEDEVEQDLQEPAM